MRTGFSLSPQREFTSTTTSFGHFVIPSRSELAVRWLTPASPLPWLSATTNTMLRRSTQSDNARLGYQDTPLLRRSRSLLACPRRFVVHRAPSSTFSAATFLSRGFSAQRRREICWID